VFKGGDDYEVVIAFDSWAADLIRGRRWHASQELTELPGRQVRLRMRLNSIEEAEQWVLSWGAHATVVRPRALVERIQKAATAMASRCAAALESWPAETRASKELAPLNREPSLPGNGTTGI
jgi:predicted DNA-binding transcriptional regulator YafY